MPEYIIVAGVNGAGKSTLFEVYPWLFENTQRINADEILRNRHGDWHKRSDTLAAMRLEINMIKAALNTRNALHANGFTVTLLYVALSSPSLAIQRVSERVRKGGHGVPADLISKRYYQSLENLPKIARMADNVKLFINDDAFSLIYARNVNTILENDLLAYPYLNGYPVNN